jgi:hypothetical protein
MRRKVLAPFRRNNFVSVEIAVLSAQTKSIHCPFSTSTYKFTAGNLLVIIFIEAAFHFPASASSGGGKLHAGTGMLHSASSCTKTCKVVFLPAVTGEISEERQLNMESICTQ